MDAERIDYDGFGGTGWLILILLFFMGFGNGWGGNRAPMGGPADTASAIYSQQAAQASADNSRSILERGYEGQLATQQAQYQTLLGFKDQQYQINTSACDIKSKVIEDGQKTRDLINSLAVTDLRAKLVEAQDQIATMEQTGALVNALRPYPTPSYIVSSPYGSLFGANGYFGY